MNRDGKAGCGCLIFILVCVLVGVGLFVHPVSLRLISNQFRYEDKIFPSDVLFVPRFDEDRNGELYIEAFREYWLGNGRAIYVEEDKLFGASILDPVNRMARLRGIKEGVVKKIEVDGENVVEAQKVRKQFAEMGCRKVIILVPEYASKRFHVLYGDHTGNGKTVYLIKPVIVSYFKKDKWWKDRQSRLMLLGEVFSMGSLYADKFKYGEKKE